MAELLSFLQETSLDLIAIVFLLAGPAKLAGLRSFREGLVYIPFMQVSWSYLIGWSLPALELLVGVGLFLNLLVAKVAALGLLGAFAAVIGLVLSRRLKVPCGCFAGLGDRYLSWASLRHNGVLALAIFLALPLTDRAYIGEGVSAAAFLLFFYLAAGELVRQRRFLAALRKQRII